MDNWQRSSALLQESKKFLAGGVSSNVRLAAKPLPLYFARGEGAILVDVDGNRYIDYVLGQGPMILGHSHPEVLSAVQAEMQRGQLYAGQHELEISVAKQLVSLLPAAELCRFGLSGSEMVQAAMRLARAATGRKKIVRFEGHYHGWFDNVLMSVAPPLDKAGPRERPHTVQGTIGQTESALEDFIVLPWNDLDLASQLFVEMGSEIAAIMCEPMMCNTGAIEPKPGYLEGLRSLCDRYGAILYFDETITGFRLGLTGAQGKYQVIPDLASYAKAMAGGFANAALVGKSDLMQRFAQDVNHSGTFNSNVISMAASAAALDILQRNNGEIYTHMNRTGTSLMDGLEELGARHSVNLHVQGVPTAFHVSFTDRPAIHDYREFVQYCDTAKYEAFAVAMLREGVRLVGRGIWYLSAAHSDQHVEKTLQAADKALSTLGSHG